MRKLNGLLMNWIVIGTVLSCVGCGQTDTLTPAPTGATPATSADSGGHSHGTGPHDGCVADWGGGKFHVEFTVSHDKQEATVYILGSDEKTPSPIKAEEIQLTIKDPAMQVTLSASPLESDSDGTASRFVGTHESLGVVQEYEGTITGVVDGTPYSGDFKEEPHGS